MVPSTELLELSIVRLYMYETGLTLFFFHFDFYFFHFFFFFVSRRLYNRLHVLNFFRVQKVF